MFKLHLQRAFQLYKRTEQLQALARRISRLAGSSDGFSILLMIAGLLLMFVSAFDGAIKRLWSDANSDPARAHGTVTVPRPPQMVPDCGRCKWRPSHCARNGHGASTSYVSSTDDARPWSLRYRTRSVRHGWVAVCIRPRTGKRAIESHHMN